MTQVGPVAIGHQSPLRERLMLWLLAVYHAGGEGILMLDQGHAPVTEQPSVLHRQQQSEAGAGQSPAVFQPTHFHLLQHPSFGWSQSRRA